MASLRAIAAVTLWRWAEWISDKVTGLNKQLTAHHQEFLLDADNDNDIQSLLQSNLHNCPGWRWWQYNGDDYDDGADYTANHYHDVPQNNCVPEVDNCAPQVAYCVPEVANCVPEVANCIQWSR